LVEINDTRISQGIFQTIFLFLMLRTDHALRDEAVEWEEWQYIMIIVLVALAVSALLGLAIGLVFRVWANAIAAPIIAFGSAIALASHGFGFFEGVLVTVACVVVSQAAYLVGAVLESRVGIANFLADDVLDDQPGDNREYEIGGEQEERREHPSRPPPPEA
jgi:hypothetical protein